MKFAFIWNLVIWNHRPSTIAFLLVTRRAIWKAPYRATITQIVCNGLEWKRTWERRQHEIHFHLEPKNLTTDQMIKSKHCEPGRYTVEQSNMITWSTKRTRFCARQKEHTKTTNVRAYCLYFASQLHHIIHHKLKDQDIDEQNEFYAKHLKALIGTILGSFRRGQDSGMCILSLCRCDTIKKS